MKKRYSIFIILILLAAGVGLSWSQPVETTLIDPSCACNAKIKDPYEVPQKYSYGYYKNICIDSCKYRSSFLIQKNTSEGTVEISNVLHEKQFWRALIPVHNVSRVELILETFAPEVNHVSFLFHFQKSIKLHSQLSEDTLEVSSLIISPEAIPPMNSKYNLYDGFIGNYALMFRVMTEEQYLQMAKELQHPLRSLTVNLSEQEASQLLLNSLQRGHKGANSVYQLFFNNCATSAIDLALIVKNKPVSEGWDMWDIVDPLRGISTDLPFGTVNSLYWWNLIRTEEIK